jgi:hypothetical protein
MADDDYCPSQEEKRQIATRFFGGRKDLTWAQMTEDDRTRPSSDGGWNKR